MKVRLSRILVIGITLGFSLQGYAIDGYQVPSVASDATTLTQVRNALNQFVTTDGRYVGVDSAGKPCGIIKTGDTYQFAVGTLPLSNGNNPEYALLDLEIQQPSNSAAGQVHLAIIYQQEEAESLVFDLTISGKNGVPTSLLESLGGLNQSIPLGEFVPASDLIPRPACQNLAKR
jgi:hypothetical protein